MKDAVDLLGKIISINELDHVIETVYFIPDAVSQEQHLYFGLKKSDGCFVNYSYYSLLPYLKEQIRL
jgi:hypothetical protein